MALLNAGFAYQCNTICGFVLQFSSGTEIEVYKGEIILIDMCRLMALHLVEALKGYPLYSQNGKEKKLFAVRFLRSEQCDVSIRSHFLV